MKQTLSQVLVTSLLPASYIDSETVSKLAGQTAQLLNGIPLDEEQQRLAFDVFPSTKHTVNLAAQVEKSFRNCQMRFSIKCKCRCFMAWRKQ